MKFILDDANSGHTIQHYTVNEITISGNVYRESLVLMPDRIIPQWRPTSFDELKVEDFIHIAAFSPEIIVLGTGSKQHCPSQELLLPL
ncbi:MAG: MTH938/NDUFAF3 family protein, partial [Candidatus Thiodiazotropha sp. 6PLUC5]